MTQKMSSILKGPSTDITRRRNGARIDNPGKTRGRNDCPLKQQGDFSLRLIKPRLQGRPWFDEAETPALPLPHLGA
jgi:hypothetical protein